MGATPVRWLLVACVAGTATAATPQPQPPPFRVEARLSPEPAQVRNHRFVLRANVAPAALAQGHASDFGLKASLVAKGGPLCPGPGSVFYSGFEAMP